MMPRWQRDVAFPIMRRNTRAAAGKWFHASIACTSTNGLGASSAGSRGMTSSLSSTVCEQARTCESRSPVRSGQRDTCRRLAPSRCRIPMLSPLDGD
jgi:hypothetical protein